MLPPILPLSVVPVTSQQDPARPRPDIPAVVPTQASSGDSTVNLKQLPDSRFQKAEYINAAEASVQRTLTKSCFTQKKLAALLDEWF